MIREHDLIVLTCDVPEAALKEGDVGTVVDLHGEAGYEVEFSTPWTTVRTADPMPHARWFSGARLNWAQHALRRGADDATALVCVQEGGRPPGCAGPACARVTGSLPTCRTPSTR